jgi:hypothetical protein
VAWEAVARPLLRGGLGVIDLKLAGFALRARWLWFQLTDDGRVWSELDMQFEPEVLALVNASIDIQVGNGRRVKFWADKWLHGSAISDLVPTLCSLVSARTKKRQTVAEALCNRRWVRSITGTLSVQAIEEYLHLWNLLSEVQLTDGEDSFTWRWTSDGCYSAKSAYNLLQQGNTGFEGAKRIWRSWAPPKVKFFTWLASRRRLWTADRRLRHGLEARSVCWFCDQELESADHILTNCSFAREVWWRVLSNCHCSCSFPHNMSLQEWWAHLRRLQPKEYRKGLDSLFMLTL